MRFPVVRSPLVAGSLCLLMTLDAGARQDVLGCGTHGYNHREELLLHQGALRAQRAARLRNGGARAAVRLVLPDVGEIAILEDAEGVVARRNEFDLAGRTLSFLPTRTDASRYRYTVGASSYEAAAAVQGVLQENLGDDDSLPLPLPFEFPFYGQRYRDAFLNSDGSITFQVPDPATADRSLGRLIAGAPRISALFRDLDPTQAIDGVFVQATPERLTVTWSDVPEYASFGRGPLQTFQVRLYPDGRIEMAYQRITTRDAVVGLSPGRLRGTPTILSFLDAAGSAGEFDGPIAERFTNTEEVDTVTAAQRFYESHDDAYDYLVFFNALGLPAASGAVAFEVTVRNSRGGFGDPPVEIGQEYGSPRRLQAVLNMGPLTQYPRDPNGRVAARGSTGDTPLTVLAHEAGHLFLSYASVRDPVRPDSLPLLGRQSAHWAFTFNSEASVMEGNRIEDQGPGARPRFRTTGTVEGFAPLDQYLMGLRAPEEVPPTFLVEEATVSPLRAPEVGVGFDGRRREVTVDEIAAIEGRRTPDVTVSQKRFRFAFVLIAPAGQTVSADAVAQVDEYRRRFEPYFAQATSRRGVAETRLQRALQLSFRPAAGVPEGGNAPGTLSLDQPLDVPLTVSLLSVRGLTRPPEAVTIPAGLREVSFPVRGLRPGVDELRAVAADARFEEAVANLQVNGPAALRLQLLSGGDQVVRGAEALPSPVVVRVTDVNDLPYGGVRLALDVVGGGAATGSSLVSDADGLVMLRWTPGAGPVHRLVLSVDGAREETQLVVRALSAPQVTGVLNGALQPGYQPGGALTIFGVDLAGGTVAVNGTPVTVLREEDGTLVIQAPALPAGTAMAELIVTTAAGSSAPFRVPVRS